MSTGPITHLLAAARDGDPEATDRLFATVYDELRKLARFHRRRWQGNETLNTTALIHEAFIRLSDPRDRLFANRTHFYATASKAMRQILVRYAERQRARKRGGDARAVPLDEADLLDDTTMEELLNLHELLTGLEADSPRRCRVVECRVFGGMSIDETSDALGISPATVKRDWQVASAWLHRAISGDVRQ